MKKLLYVLLTMTVAFAMVACSNGSNSDTTPTLSSENTLTGITIGGVNPDVTDYTNAEGIPTAITSVQWDDVSGNPYIPVSPGGFSLTPDQIANGPIAVTVSGGNVVYAKGASDTLRASFAWGAAGSVFPLTDGDFLYVRVTAENGARNYYKFSIANAATNARIRGIVIETTADTYNLGSGPIPAEDPDDIDDWSFQELSRAEAINSVVKVTPMASIATIRLARVANAFNATTGLIIARPAAGDWVAYTVATGNTLTFDNNDGLFIEVISNDQSNKLYYLIKFEVGTNAKLASIGIETPKGMGNVNGHPSWNEAVDFATVPGNAMDVVFMTDRQPTGTVGLGINIVAQDREATVEYFLSGEDDTLLSTEPTWVDYPASGIARQVFNIEAKYFLYIKVTSYSQTNTLYFIKQLQFPAKGKLTYGNPTLSFDPADMAFWTSDNKIQTFYVNRVNESESGVAEYLRHPEWGGLHTSAEVKAVWNDDGIFFYVDVKTRQFRRTEAGNLENRPIGYAPTGNDHHLGDSFEAFVNERLQEITTGQQDIGNQFRVAPQPGTPGYYRSGRAIPSTGSYGTSDTAAAIYNDWVANGTSLVRLKNTNGTADNGENGGYEVLTFVPFSEFGLATAVFEDNGIGGKQVKDGAEIGLELQFNTGITNGARDGILTWNGVTTGSYAHAENYGVVELNLDSKPRIVNAQMPTITTQPANVEYTEGATPSALTVVATTTQTGSSLSYQWYKGTSATDANPTPLGTNSASYIPDISDGVTYYYWVVVTNTNSSVNGVQTRSITSSKVAVVIRGGTVESWLDRISGVTGNHMPVYVFDIPVGKKLGDYTKILLDIKFEGTPAGRLRTYGPVANPNFGGTAPTNALSVTNPDDLISDAAGGLPAGVTAANTWYEGIASPLTFEQAKATSAKAAAGMVALAIGPGNTTIPSYRIKNVVLADDDGNTVAALRPDDPFLWGGQGANVSAQFYGASAGFTRVLYGDETEIPTLPPAPSAPAAATTAFVVDVTKSSALTNTASWATDNYNNGLVFKLVDSAGEEIKVGYLTGKVYSTATVVLKVYDSTNVEITSDFPSNNLQAKFHRTVVGNANGTTVGSPAQVGLSSSNTTYDNTAGAWIFTVAVPTNIHAVEGDNFNWLEGTLAAMSIQSGGYNASNGDPQHDICFIELVSITLE